MQNKQQSLLHYQNNKLFVKLTLTNTLKESEIDALNIGYHKFKLNLKQITVDKFGNEITISEIIKNKKILIIKPEIYNGCFQNENNINNKKQKLYEKDEKQDKQEKNGKNENYDKKEESDEKLSEDELKAIINELKKMIQNFEQIDIKKSKYDNSDEFKFIVIHYIKEYKKYLDDDDFQLYYNRYKNKAMNFIDLLYNDANNLMNWPLNILKIFKNILYAVAINKLINKSLTKEKENNDKIEN